MTGPRAGATKRKLFDATLRLAGARGLTGITVDEIAAEAGVAKGTVYYNFGSKDGLIDALLRYGVDLLATRLSEATSTPDPEAGLEYLVDAALEFISEYPGFSQILVAELWRTPGQWHETLAPLRADIVSIMREQLQLLRDAGKISDSVAVATAAAGLFGTVLVVGLDWLVFQPELSRAQVHDSVMRLARGITGDQSG